MTCDAALRALFSPPHPQVGRYEVCTTAEPLGAIIPDGFPREFVGPLDAFGMAGAYNRAGVSRLYGGTKPLVARGWIRRNGALESVTFVSPYPDAAVRHLIHGTLIIRHIICCS